MVTFAVIPLAGWRDFCQLPYDYDLRSLGIVQSRADVNRFRARFRAATAFQSIHLEGYSDSTIQGYSAFSRALFVYSAFESFMALIGKKPWELGDSLERHGAKEVLERLWLEDSDHRFYEFLHTRVNDNLKIELEKFARLDPCNIALLAGAIRHIFAHGHLTPNVSGVSPKRSSKICNLLSDFLLRFMSAEFKRLVRNSYSEGVCG